jgi:hypothetical protein
MARTKTAEDILGEIREVISDMNRHNFLVVAHRSVGGLRKGQTDRLDASLATEIIADLLTGKAGTLTRDYRRTKADAAKAAGAAANPTP